VVDHSGTITTDTITGISIAKPIATASYLTLCAHTGNNLTLTHGHHLPVGPTCCASLKKAGDIRVGETVHLVTKAGTTIATAIVKTTGALTQKMPVKQGLYSPVTAHGTYPIVDGFATAFDSAHMVALASYTLPLLEATGTTHLLKRFLLSAEFVEEA
jgi:hypothetical protein